MKNKLIVVFLAALFCSMPPILAAQQPAEWTLMFYMDSDNNLEAPQMADLEEMMAVGSTKNVNIVALVDRHVSGDEDDNFTNRAVGGLGNWTTAKYVVVEKGRLRQLQDLGELNMGDPANLTSFIERTIKSFPAKHYGLVFGDHGEGWLGILSDEGGGGDGDGLTMTELGAALAATAKTAGKFEMIGFDACLMANFEAARTVAPFAKVMVASEELEPGDGWSYTPTLTALNRNPQMDGFALGRTIVDEFKKYYFAPDQGNRKDAVTLGVVDCARVEALNAALGDLGTQNQALIKTGGRGALIKTANARSGTEDFGANGKGKDSSEFFDLVHYAENIKAAAGDAATAKAADAVVAAAKAAVVYNIKGAAHPRSSGLSVFFPNHGEPLVANGYAKQPFAPGLKWSGLLFDYTGIIVQDTEKPAVAPVQTTNTNIGKTDSVVITSRVKGDDIDEATFVLAEAAKDQTIIIGAIPTEPDEKGILREQWDGSWFSIGDGKTETVCPITDFYEIDDAQDIYYAEVPAQVRYRGRKEWHDITMYFVIDFNEEQASGRFVYAFEDVRGQQSEVDIESGDAVRPVYLSVNNATNESELIAATDEADILHIDDRNELLVGMMDVAPGNYLVGFAVTDYAGNDNDSYVEVTIK